MRRFFRYVFDGYAPVNYTINPIRWIEAILCIICLILLIYIVGIFSTLSTLFAIILAGTPLAFTIITVIDLISNSFYNPIYWNTWILFSTTGALLFFLCVGILLAHVLTTLLIVALIFFLITAIVFLIDTLYAVYLLMKQRAEVWPAKQSQVVYPPSECYCNDAIAPPPMFPENESTEMTFERRYQRHVRDGTREVVDEERVLRTSSHQLRNQRVASSYGGTFPMSKDAAPLPSPEPSYSPVCPVGRKKPICPKSTVPSRICRGQDGRMYMEDGTPLIECRTDSGQIVYQDPCGVLYGRVPSGEIAPVEATYERPPDVRRSSKPPLVEKRGCSRCTGRSQKQLIGTQRSEAFRSPDSRMQDVRMPSGQMVYEAPASDPYLSTEQVRSLESKQTFTKVNADRECISVRKLSKTPKIVSCDYEQPSAVGGPCVCGDRSPSNVRKEIDTPRKSRTSSAGQSPNEMAVSSRTVAISTRMVPKSRGSQRSLSAPGSPEARESKGRAVKSADTAPGSAVAYQYQQQTPSVVYHQYVQKPCHCGKVHYQTATTVHGTVCASSCPFYLQPKESPTLPPNSAQGSVCIPACPYYTKQQQDDGDPDGLYQKPSDDCDPNCPYREQPEVQNQPNHCDTSTCPYYAQPQPEFTPQSPSNDNQQVLQPPEPADRPPLQTISECECETDPSSVWGDQTNETSPTTSPPTSSDYVEARTSYSCKKCYLCDDKSCSAHQAVKIETDEVQTSETRMVRASDVQRLSMSVNLPGTADSHTGSK